MCPRLLYLVSPSRLLGSLQAASDSSAFLRKRGGILVLLECSPYFSLLWDPPVTKVVLAISGPEQDPGQGFLLPGGFYFITGGFVGWKWRCSSSPPFPPTPKTTLPGHSGHSVVNWGWGRSLERGGGQHRVGPHVLKDQPVPDLQLRQFQAICNSVQPIASWSPEAAVVQGEIWGGFLQRRKEG